MSANAKVPPVITDDLKGAVKLYLAAIAHHGVVKPRIDAIHAAALAKCPLRYTDENRKLLAEHGKDVPQFVTDVKDSYLSRDDDFNAWLAAKQELLTAAGFQVEYGKCPLLMAEDGIRKAKRVVLDASSYITHVTPDDLLCSRNGLENYNKMVELVVGLVLSLSPDIDKASVLDHVGVKPPAAAAG